MKLARLRVALQKLAGRKLGNSLTALQAPDTLRATLERERARANRSGEHLSLVTFVPRCPATDLSTLDVLTRVLKNRLRATDEAGWLDSRQIGVVLPATPTAGAWKFADDICLEFPSDAPPPICTVYSHPLDWPPSGAESEQVREGSGLSLDKRTLGLELLFMRPLPLWKRALDVTGATVGLVVLLPVMTAAATAVRLSSPGPVLFRQWRTGWGGCPFVILKFRTMVADAEQRKPELRKLNEQDGPAFKVRKDPRVTRIGRFLRCTSLDELPQLWNILVGQMSLVGPRPLPCSEAEECEPWHRQRLDVVPGLTGIWQVKGRSKVTFAEWVRMDLEYMRSQSLWQDLRLLMLTVPAVLLRKGAH